MTLGTWLPLLIPSRSAEATLAAEAAEAGGTAPRTAAGGTAPGTAGTVAGAPGSPYTEGEYYKKGR